MPRFSLRAFETDANGSSPKGRNKRNILFAENLPSQHARTVVLAHYCSSDPSPFTGIRFVARGKPLKHYTIFANSKEGWFSAQTKRIDKMSGTHTCDQLSCNSSYFGPKLSGLVLRRRSKGWREKKIRTHTYIYMYSV